MALIKKIFREIIWILSETEALLAEPNNALKIRRIYLGLQGVQHKKDLWIGRGLRLLEPGKLLLGERCALGDFVIIANHAPITIGDDFLGASGLHLDSGTHDPVTLKPKNLPIRIGNRVWCGINVTILAGVTIGDDVVLGAGSVVCKDIPSNSIAVGVPAKVIKPLVREADKPLWSWVSGI